MGGYVQICMCRYSSEDIALRRGFVARLQISIKFKLLQFGGRMTAQRSGAQHERVQAGGSGSATFRPSFLAGWLWRWPWWRRRCLVKAAPDSIVRAQFGRWGGGDIGYSKTQSRQSERMGFEWNINRGSLLNRKCLYRPKLI